MKRITFSFLAVNFISLLTPLNIPAQESNIIKTEEPKSSKNSVIKYGIASYYAKKFNGRTTSNGSIYNSAKLTAACNLLPLGTWVKVTNLRNKRFVIVQINDRMHRKNKRLIDLSKSGAQKLGYVSRGITRVKVEVLGKMKVI